jgi:hypothetical protein
LFYRSTPSGALVGAFIRPAVIHSIQAHFARRALFQCA